MYQNNTTHKTNNGFGHSSEAAAKPNEMEYQIEKSLYQAPQLFPSIWRRLYGAENRFYFPAIGEEGIWAGITTILDKCLPTSKEMKDWLIENKWEGLFLRAEYGTAGHTAIADFTLGLDWRNNIAKKEWFGKIENMIVAWNNTISAYKIEQLLMIETPIKGKINGCNYVTTVDFCAKMRVPYIVKKEKIVETGEVYKVGDKAGQPKTKVEKYTETEWRTETWIIDFKTNYDGKENKDYYDSHLFQLIAQKRAIKQQYNIDVTRIFNWTEKAFKVDNGDNTFQLVEWVMEGNERVGAWQHKGFSQADFTVLLCHMKVAKVRGFNIPSGKLRAKSYVWDSDNRLVPISSVITYKEFVENWRKQKENKEIEEEMDSTDTHQLLFIRSTYPEYTSIRAEHYAESDNEWILKGYVKDMQQADIDRLIGEQEGDCADQRATFKAKKDWFLLVKSL